MWDPARYQDTDYGLDPDETFEPTDLGDLDSPDLSRPFIMTVLGPISPDQLGVCQPHEHILSGTVPPAGSGRGLRFERAVEELEAYALAGGHAMVDVTTAGEGRDVEGLLRLAQRVPIHLIAATGPGPESHASPIGAILEDISDGIDQLGVWPGIVACPGSASVDSVVEAVSAAISRGWPVTIPGALAGETLSRLERHGGPAVDPGRLMARVGDGSEWDEVLGLAGLGCWLVFTGIRTGSESELAGRVAELAQEGYAGQAMVSQGASIDSAPEMSGEPTWTRLLERFTLLLMDAGVSAGQVRAILIDNPARALAIHPAP